MDSAFIEADSLTFDSVDIDLSVESLGGVIFNIGIDEGVIGEEVALPGSIEFEPFNAEDIKLVEFRDGAFSEDGINADNGTAVVNRGLDISGAETDNPAGQLASVNASGDTRALFTEAEFTDLADIVPGLDQLEGLTSSALLDTQVGNLSVAADLDFSLLRIVPNQGFRVLQTFTFEPDEVKTTFTVEGVETEVGLGEAATFNTDDVSASELADGEVNGSVSFELGGRLIATTVIIPEVNFSASTFSITGSISAFEPGTTPSPQDVATGFPIGVSFEDLIDNDDELQVTLLNETVITLPEGFFQPIIEEFAIEIADAQPPEFANARAEIEVMAGERSVLEFGPVDVSDPDTNTPIRLQFTTSAGRLFAASTDQVTANENLRTLTLVGLAEDLENFLLAGRVEVEIPEDAGNQELRILGSDRDGFDNVPFEPIQLIVNPDEDQVGGVGGSDAGDTFSTSDRNQDGEDDDPLDRDSPFSANGGAGNDTFFGGNGNDFFVGGDDNDLGSGGGGEDQLFGGNGRDFLLGEGGFDSLFGGDDNDRLFGGGNSDRLFGGGGDDSLDGGEGADNLFGGEGNDTLFGGDGPDFAEGGPGDDSIRAEAAVGGLGDDQIDDADVASGGAGNDTISGREISGNDGDDILFATEIAFGGNGDDDIEAVGFASGGDGEDTIEAEGAGRFEGGDGNDSIFAFRSDEGVEILGEDGSDDLTGSRQADVIFGGDGADVIDGREGNDLLEGGEGDDVIVGGEAPILSLARQGTT